MSRKYKTHAGGLYFVTLTVVGWIDLFTRPDYADLVLEGLRYCMQHKGLRVYAYVIMPSHIHLLADLADDEQLLAEVLRSLKSYLAKQIYQLIETHPQESRRDWLLYQLAYFGHAYGQAYQVWQHDSHPIALLTPDRTHRCRDYIHQNPVVSRLVTKAHYYPFCSACPDQQLPLTELGM